MASSRGERPWRAAAVAVSVALALWAAPSTAEPDRGGERWSGAERSAGDRKVPVAAGQATSTSGSSAPVAAPAPADDEERSGYLERVAWVGFGVAAVGVTAWAITGGVALAKSESLADECSDDVCPADREGDLDSARSFAQAATASLVVGILGGLTGAIALLAADGEEQGARDGSEAAAVEPLLGPGYVGLQGRF